MLYPNGHFGIIAEQSLQRVSIFDTDTLEVLQSIPLNADVLDVALTPDCQRAVVCSFDSKTFFQIYLSGKHAELIGSATADTFLEDIHVTPDGRFAVSVDGAAENQNIVSYSLNKNIVVSSLPADAQAVAISPTRSGLVLAVAQARDSVRRYEINNNGQLYDTEQDIFVGESPNNVNFSSDGKFAFVANFVGSVSALSTVRPNQISLISTATAGHDSFSMAVTKSARHLFVLGSGYVDIYAFDPIAGYLAYLRSFEHGLRISSFYGVDQIALDQSESRLFISAIGQVAVFTTYGTLLGTVKDAEGPGGLDICSCRFAYRPTCYGRNRVR